LPFKLFITISIIERRIGMIERIIFMKISPLE